MNTPKKERKNWLLERFQEYCIKSDFFIILQEVFDQFFVVKEEPSESSNWEDNKNEEEIEHEDSSYFVSQIDTEKELTLWEEVEGKLLYIAFEDYQKKYTIKRVFANHFGYSVVEKSSES